MPRANSGMLDRVAEMLADGTPLAEVAARPGISPAQANAYLQRMRDQLGREQTR